MAFIKVPILCYAPKSEVNKVNELLEKLDLPIDDKEDETVFKESKLNTCHIVHYFANDDTDRTTVDTVTGPVVVGLTYDEFDKIVSENSPI